MSDIVMPRLSDSMEEGTIVRWLRVDGDDIAVGDELVEIETDKATMVYEADVSGALTIVAAEGTTVAIGQPIAGVGPPPAPARGDSAIATATALAAPTRSAVGVESRGGRTVKASPVARRLAAREGVTLAELAGSGPAGRVVKADVIAVLAVDRPRHPEPATAPREAPVGDTVLGPRGHVKTIEPSRGQALVAQRMALSRATVPESTLRVQVDMEAAVSLREQMRGVAALPVLPSLNDLIVRAVAVALREHPLINGAYIDGRFERYDRVNVGVAVSAAEALLVPTIFDADRKSVSQIARETRALAERARAGTIAPAELEGGTFTVSNLGMFGIDSFDAVVNPPQAAILAVGSVTKRPAARDGELVVRRVAEFSLSCDHRIIYGADAAAFLDHVRARLETPMTIV